MQQKHQAYKRKMKGILRNVHKTGAKCLAGKRKILSSIPSTSKQASKQARRKKEKKKKGRKKEMCARK